jgi:hypothetical protein
MENMKEIAALKQAIRGRLHAAAMRSDIDGHEALGILLSLAAEFVSKVGDDDLRNEFVGTVVGSFPAFVELERNCVEGMRRQ